MASFDFEKYAYRGRGGRMAAAEEEKAGKGPCFTPSKAEPHTIPETPDPDLPTLPPQPQAQGRARQRRRARIPSSSEDEVETLSAIENTPRKSGGLFSGLPFSKRLKKEDPSGQKDAENRMDMKQSIGNGLCAERSDGGGCGLNSGCGSDSRSVGGCGFGRSRRLFEAKKEEGKKKVLIELSSDDATPVPPTTRCTKVGKRRGRAHILGSDTESEDNNTDVVVNSSGGWLTTRCSTSARERLSRYAFTGRKAQRNGGGREGQRNRVSAKVTRRVLAPTSSPSCSSSEALSSGSSSDEGTVELSSSQESNASSSADSSCVLVSSRQPSPVRNISSRLQLSSPASGNRSSPSSELPRLSSPVGKGSSPHCSSDGSCLIVSVDSADSAAPDPQPTASPTKGSPDSSADKKVCDPAAKFYGRTRATAQREEPSNCDVDLDKLDEDYNSDVVSDTEDYSAKQRGDVLEFLNHSNLEQLCDIRKCSVAKAKRLVELRPFEEWSTLMDVLASKKSLGPELIDNCLLLIHEKKMMKQLLCRCQTISASLQTRLSALCPSAGAVGTVECLEGDVRCSSQPAILNKNAQLKPFQLVGLNWLAMLHSLDLNGILADEMGLGKTVQAIAFLAHLFEEGLRGTYLVIVPTSTINNWAREFEKWCPGFKVLVYYHGAGNKEFARYEILYGEGCQVVLTTYVACIGDRKMVRKLSLDCVVFDEAHMLKNMSSQRYGYLMKIKAKRRLLLTGTPVQNNLLELVSLLSFVMPEVFKEFSSQLKTTFSQQTHKKMEQSSYYTEQVKQASQIMQPFVLRRYKSQVLDDLPAKVERTEFCSMTESQLQCYTAAVARAKENRGCKNGVKNHDLRLLTQLREITMHPLLVRQHYDDQRLRLMAKELLKDPSHRGADVELVYEDMTVMSDFELHRLCGEKQVLKEYVLSDKCLEDSGKCQYLKTKLLELKNKGSRVLLFSQFKLMLDVMEVFLQLNGHTYLRLDGSTKSDQRQALIDQYNSSEDIFIFLLSTRAGGVGINLTSANVVILHDIDFNPYVDKQAQDRCHRVGQTRDVDVIRLICKDSVEVEIMSCAEAKLKLEQDLDNISSADMSSSDVAAILERGLAIDNQS